MQRNILLIIFCFITLSSFSDWYITRGPNPGEIYFMGSTYTGSGIYYSNDYGQTAQCMDSTIWQAMRITADITPGVVYYVTMVEALYRSNNYGSQNTWQYVNYSVNLEINSGVDEGFIYNAFTAHSENNGNTFIPHSYNGFYGSCLEVEIDNETSVGYVLVNQLGINDSLFLLKSVDNFENLELQYTFYLDAPSYYGSRRISRGVNPGEIFLFMDWLSGLLLSQNYGSHWIKINKFNLSNPYFHLADIVGGRTEGEIYTLYRWSNLMGQNAHTYILYSTDYGITYEVYHPFAKGQEPLLSQFSAKSEEDVFDGVDIKSIDSVYFVTGDMPLNVQFYNYSIGNINLYEWDFDNDGIVDSNEENPVYTFTDTGWYSINIAAYDDYDTSSFLRENYIYVYELTNVEEIEGNLTELSYYPNPITDVVSIEIRPNFKMIEIYDLNGKSHYAKTLLQENKTEIIDLQNLEKGIYLLKIKTEEQKITKKIIKI